MRVTGYIRVSTEEQAVEGVSLAAQREKIRLYCQLHSLTLVDMLEDPGVSAKSLKRPGLTQALEMLESGDAAGMVIAKLDRLSRDVGDWSTLVDTYFGERAGKYLMSAADSIDTRTAAGRLVLNVLMSVAQWEREAIGERTKAALSYKKSKGERVGTIPFGFDVASDGKTLVANPDEQAVLASMRTMQEDGMSIREIARELNRQCRPAKNGGKWSKSVVHEILRRVAA